MSEPPIGLLTFGPIDGRYVISFNMTFTQGASPSVCTIETAPVDIPFPKSAALQIEYDGQSIIFPGATIDKIEPTGDSDGRVTWKITVLDRRWIWRETGAITGRYNYDPFRIKEFNFAGVGHASLRTVRQLMRLCLDELREFTAAISPGINGGDDYPEINWDYERPAEALADLCDRTNNVIVLGLDNVVRIFPKGVGAELPIEGNDLLIEAQRAADPPESPQRIIVIGKPDRYQVDVHLEAVGREIDGEVKPINELSYAPVVNGQPDWSENDYILHPRVEEEFRPLAEETVWKWYRIRVGFSIPGTPFLADSMEEIKPILDSQVEIYTTPEGVANRPLWVYGRYSPLDDRLDAKQQAIPKLSNQPDGLYRGSFSVDYERGIVQFADPVVILEKVKRAGPGAGATGMYVYPAELLLRCAFNYRPGEQGAQLRTKFFDDVVPPGATAGQFFWDRYAIDEAVERTIYFDYEKDEVVDNVNDQRTKAQQTYNTVLSEYQSFDSAVSATYAGILPFQCDGAITQVTWTRDRQGYCYTRASRNREEAFIAPLSKERRTAEKLASLLRPRK